jgi:thiamine kinase-like enzyme
MNALSDQLLRRVATLRPDWNTEEVSGFLYLEGGYSNDNYRFEYQGDRYVLRAPYMHRAFVDRGLEQSLYRGRAAVGMPELIAFDAGTGHMISRWVPGTLLADRRSRGDELVEYLQRLHRRMPQVERLYDPLAHARGYLETAGAPDWVETLAMRMSWAPEQLVSCHNDLNPWNVICTPDGEWVTLDWEWVGRNDPLFDLVTLHQGTSPADTDLSGLAERYLGAPPPASRLARCLTVFWLRETIWAMAEIAAGNDRREVLEQQRIGLERLRGLAERA